MKFFISNPVLDKEIVDIKRKITLSMNGVVSDKMRENGILYEKNYGVIVPRIKEIAGEYTANGDLAQRLWAMKYRETMIMATILQPIDEFQITDARLWLAEINQNELAEQIVMNLLVKTEFAEELIKECLDSENKWMQVCGFLMAARLYQNISDEIQTLVIQHAFEKSVTDNLHVYKSIAVCLGRFCRNGEKVQRMIKSGINNDFSDNNAGQNFIKEEISQEILFFQK